MRGSRVAGDQNFDDTHASLGLHLQPNEGIRRDIRWHIMMAAFKDREVLFLPH
jgi:hypothetical protein